MGAPKHREWIWNPAQKLDTPYRAKRAVRYGSGAAGLIAGWHLFYTVTLALQEREFHTWFIRQAHALALINGVMATLAAILAVMIYRRSSLLASSIVLAWAILQTQRWLTFGLYGYAASSYLRAFVLLLAALGLRGALAKRRFAADLR